MESNNPFATGFSFYTATASSSEGCFSHSNFTSQPMFSDQPPPNQRNDDKRKQTRSNGSEENNNNNRNEKRGRSNNQRKTSEYLGVSRQAGRYEAFIWDSSVLKPGDKRKSAGGFENEIDAAKARDLFAIKIWGNSARTNFPPSTYGKELLEMKDMSREECIAAIRKMSNDDRMKRMASKGLSVYRGVYRIPEQNRWQARVGKGKNLRGLYVGTFDSEEEAARAFDIATIRLKGPTAATNLNFDRQSYDIESILKSTKIPIGKGASKLIKKCTADEILSRITDNNPDPPSTNFLEQYHLMNPHLVNTDPVVSWEVADSVNEFGVPIGDPFGEQNQTVANSETFVYGDSNDPMRFRPDGFSEFPIEVEDNTESLWNEVYGESLMDHLLSASDSLNEFEKGLDSMADIDWIFAEEEPQEPAGGINQTTK
ncbi:AP2-like ethylene-responsive transcription factor AIL6 [Neltuma alba]|uniref:AP2-like ethylene-responsive transcription factor AIL6 n=1 Tax=Neltuma alba TaxID=207710 RepID=UPI0010A4B862|nr:AP2-like ethylene-responsive transcription factor AIL6 [Prosopis alba]